MSSEAQKRYMKMVLSGHAVRSQNVEVHVEMDGGDCCSVFGHSTSFVKVGLPEVALLSEDSTPQKFEMHPDAERAFEAAAKRLIQDGVEFYTVLRPGWALPALRWMLGYR